jgi:hypothetical protein
VTVAGRRGRKPLFGQMALETPSRVLKRGSGFWAKGVEKVRISEPKSLRLFYRSW